MIPSTARTTDDSITIQALIRSATPSALFHSQEVSIDSTRARQGRAFPSIFFGLFLRKGD